MDAARSESAAPGVVVPCHGVRLRCKRSGVRFGVLLRRGQGRRNRVLLIKDFLCRDPACTKRKHSIAVLMQCPEVLITVKRIVWSKELAESEVERLNRLNVDKESLHAWPTETALER